MSTIAGPTLTEIRDTWPATVRVSMAAKALDLSVSYAYRLAAADQFPVRVIRAGTRILVPTADLLRLLEGEAA